MLWRSAGTVSLVTMGFYSEYERTSRPWAITPYVFLKLTSFRRNVEAVFIFDMPLKSDALLGRVGELGWRMWEFETVVKDSRSQSCSHADGNRSTRNSSTNQRKTVYFTLSREVRIAAARNVSTVLISLWLQLSRMFYNLLIRFKHNSGPS